MLNLRFICVLFILVYSPGLYSQKVSANDSALFTAYLTKAKKFARENPDSMGVYVKKSLEVAIKLGKPDFISLAKERYGFYYKQKEDYGLATRYFIEALTIEEKQNNQRRIADLNDDLGIIYMELEKFQKSLDYYSKALKIYESFQDTVNIARALLHIGSLHNSREYCENRTDQQKMTDFATAIDFYKRALKLLEKIHNESGIINANHNIGNTYVRMRKPKLAEPYFEKCLKYYQKEQDWDGLIGIYRNYGLMYMASGESQKAIGYFLKSIEEAKKRNMTEGIQFVYGELSQAYDNVKDYKNARDYYVKYMIIRDSIYNNEKSRQIFELETKYQIASKEKEILTLQIIKKRKDFLIYSLIFVVSIVLIISIFVIYRIRSKKKIAEQAIEIKEQKILQLEKDRQLLATKAVLEGEEKERGRLARDLHDGLGGLLSGVKLKLTNMKNHYVVTQETVDNFDHALNLLDHSIKELRRVAHNMMPEALIKYGLKDALQDFCDQIAGGKEIKLSFSFFGEARRFDPAIETSLFRITQELVNNALKHSRASEIIVQFIQESNRVYLSVQDNGVGFDPTQVDITKSAGLQNIRARVESFKGRIDIDSQPQKGTEIGVEFKF